MLDLVMDLTESGCAAEDKEEAPENTTLPRFENGSCGNEVVGLASGQRVDIKTSPGLPNPPNGKPIGIAIGIGIGIEEQPLEPQPPSITSTAIESTSRPPSPPPSGVTPPTTTASKGYGLRKWRRKRRDYPKDGSTVMDLNRILKRGLSIVAEPSRPRHASPEINPNSEGSVASANSAVKSSSVPSVVSPFKGSNSDSRLAAGSTFPVPTDSENSKDRSSKSSTAASAPNLRYDVPLSVGGSSYSSRDKSKIKNLSGNASAGAVHKEQHRKNRIETGKKSKAERFKIDQENSYSWLEPDSRSSNVLFAQMESTSPISNGKHSKKSSNYDGKNCDEAHISEMQFRQEVRTDHGKENGVEVEYVSPDDVAADMSSEVKEEESDNHQPTTDQDPLADSIFSLLSVQESLEREIEKFGEIGWETVFLADESIPSHHFPAGFASVDPETCEPNSSDPLCFKEIKPCSLPNPEVQLIEVEQGISRPESNPEGASAACKVKENRGESLKGESGSTLKFTQEFRQLEIELEDLIKQKIEAEVEYMVITRSTQNLEVATTDRISFIEEQKSLVGEHTQMLQKLRHAEGNAVFLKRQAEELEVSCGELLGTEEVLGLQNGVCKFSLCFLIQLILLFVVLGIFLLKLLPHSAGSVPT
ncbi:WPP domain-interacting protein 1-like [Macadamia integrifolia]|uniref:WPP domain-interacting protein 1-like n=1 Tax=Macadamia integrifolia TaxID=60698 RepID=UPI001C4F28A3|nr:WPP domain-interacting protein 1-like [Macadamia integrifolia]